MSSLIKRLIQFSLLLLLLALSLGTLSSWAFLYPETFNKFLPFYQLRPMHVSAALFWIISGAVVTLIYCKKEEFRTQLFHWPEKVFALLWIATIVLIFVAYGFRKFGGREYWEFPPMLSIPLLVAWVFLMIPYFGQWKKSSIRQPLYVWMWSTGILFFLITFLEQNLWHIDWFRQSFLREITVQWKSNGAMVGAWNQMIYGSSLFVMVKLSNDKQLANNKRAFFFYFLGLTNLMFNWGHHIYNVPTASWIRHVSYAISMTEWLIFISIIQGFKQKMKEQEKYKHLITYRFLIASEYWVFLNLILALFMSIPAINRYTHGTHITVAHAMGATIGINTMILLATFSYILRIDKLPSRNIKAIKIGFIITHLGLLIFWLGLIAAGVTKGYRTVAMKLDNYQEIMKPVLDIFNVVAYSGTLLLVGMSIIIYHYLASFKKTSKESENFLVKDKSLETSLVNQPQENLIA